MRNRSSIVDRRSSTSRIGESFTRLALGALLFAVPIGIANGQSPADRAMLAAWDDSLQRIANVTELSAYEGLARAGSGATKDLRRSLFQIRSAELRNDRPDIELALDNLASDLGDHNNWPWIHFALARAFLRMELHRRPLLTSRALLPQEPYLTGAWRHLGESLKLDRAFPPALTLAASTMLASGDRTLRANELTVLRIAIDRSFPGPDILLVWARHLRSLRLYDSARIVLGRAVFAGGDRSRLALERARTAMAQNDSLEATRSYWEGLHQLTAAGRDLYRFDLAWLLTPDSLEAFDRVPIAEVEVWMRRFWNERDAFSANIVGDRVLDHLRRWVVATTQYRLMEPWNRIAYTEIEPRFDFGGDCITKDHTLYDLLRWQPSLPGDLRNRELFLDHRGVIYMHHGEPIVRIGSRPLTYAPIPESEAQLMRTAGVVRPPAVKELTAARSNGIESWLYFMDGRYRMINFMGSSYLGTYAATTLKGFLPLSVNSYNARARYIPEYALAASALAEYERIFANEIRLGIQKPARACVFADLRNVVKLSRSDAKTASTTDSDSPPISEPWAAIIRSYALGHTADSTGMALITFAFGAKDIKETFRSANGLYEFPVDIRVVAYQTSIDRTIAIDTTRFLYTNIKTGWLTGVIEVPLPGGDWQIAVYARQGDGKGGAYQVRRNLLIDASAFALSDIVVGRADATAWRAPDGQPFGVNPVGVWPVKGTADMYFEVRGLDAGASYSTTIQVKQTGAKGLPPIDIRTTDQASGALTSVRKHLALEKLAPGSYEVTVIVEANGRKAQRMATIVIDK